MINISQQAMLYIDIGILVLYVYFLIAGYKKGFLLQIVSTLCSFLSLFLAWRYCDIFAKRFQLLPLSWAPFQDTVFKDAAYLFCNQIVAFLMLFIVLKVVFYFLEKLVTGIQEIPVLKQISGILGSLLGVVGATIWVLIICVLLNLPLFKNGHEVINATLLGTVNKGVVDASKKYGGPLDATDVFNRIYTSTKDMNEKDRDTVIKWLDDNGFKEINKSEGEGVSQDESRE